MEKSDDIRQPLKNREAPIDGTGPLEEREAPDKIKVALYARKSREDRVDKEATLDMQITVLKQMADTYGIKDYDLFQEVDSSIKFDRPQLTALLKNIARYDYIYVTHIDRLARDVGILDDIKHLCIEHDVKIRTPDNLISFDNDNEELLYGFTSVLSSFEYKRIRHRLISGKINAVKYDHKYVFYPPPYGYDISPDQKLVPSKTETLAGFNLIKELALKNYSYNEIARQLNKRGYKTQRNNEFNNEGVREILNNRHYLGELRYNSKSTGENIVIPNAHEPLMTEEEWEKIQKFVYNRGGYKPNTRLGVKTSLDGLLRCSVCKNNYVICVPKNRSKDPTIKRDTPRVFKCKFPNEETGEYCNGMSFQIPPVEEVVFEALEEKSDEILEELNAIENEDTDEITDLIRDKADDIGRQLSRKHSTLTRLLDLYLEGDIDKEAYKSRKRTLKQQIRVLEDDSERVSRELSELDTTNVVADLTEKIDVIKQIKSAPLKEQNRLLQTIIKYVDVYRPDRDNMDITIHWL